MAEEIARGRDQLRTQERDRAARTLSPIEKGDQAARRATHDRITEAGFNPVRCAIPNRRPKTEPLRSHTSERAGLSH